MVIDTERPTYPIGSVDSALRLLLMVTERDRIRITEAAKELGVARSTAHRLMQMLHYYGFVSQDDDSKSYAPGPVLVRLGLQVVRDLDIRTISQPHMEALVEELQETVHLMALQSGAFLTCLESLQSPQVLRTASRTGSVLPAFASAAGRAILASRSNSEVRKLYPSARLPKIRAATIGTQSELLAELARIRERGHAIQQEEMDPGVSAVAAAITDAHKTPSFAICVAMPTTRLTAADIPRIGQAVMRCAASISRALSFPGVLEPSGIPD